ncbi:aromatic acid exporter family protein [Alkalicoccus daliensis]|uniref:Uncharacterized membrane protein YgaE, UPF0421/DUF939 family n=1 Tax=Alkalicoccus daliensis TaxID=745820 RepID=A0A1H0B2V3_9BACI|nr:aromatic acid exporter family protein [Alkalicoccus daliensis]SDN39946.1 Uncharacterized membrane protein YgaE, UPF0421/DUF939 family [Alkalicoccus daliensis]
MFGIGYRTLKTAVGASVAILIAQMLQLEFFASAGILTILCIQKTRKKSFQSAWERMLACFLGLAAAGLIFELIGYHFISVALLLLIFIPITVQLKITSGIVTSAVIMFHVYTAGALTAELMLNELALISIGVGIALLMNIYIPSNESVLDSYQEELESLYAKIFHEFAAYIKNGDNKWNGKEITEASELLINAKNLAMQNLENHIFRYEDSYYHYFKMREKQLDIIERMMPLLTSIDYHVEQADMLAAFMDDLAEGVHPANTAHLYIEKLEKLQNSFKEMPLPDTRDEFEARSALAHLVRELDQYLWIKQQFKVTKKYGVFESDK